MVAASDCVRFRGSDDSAVTPKVEDPAMRNGPTSLYRLHDAQGGLLYVGIAGNPGRRFQEHAGTKAWWGQVRWVHLQHYPTRTEAEAAEITAIRTERPKHNVAQVTDPLSGRPRISSVFTALAYGNPHVSTIIACLAVAYGALMFTPGAEFARTHLGTSPGLSYLYPPVFAAAAFVVALEVWQRSVEQKPTLPHWGCWCSCSGSPCRLGSGATPSPCGPRRPSARCSSGPGSSSNKFGRCSPSWPS
jgi:predicted GIY-YIG superfamily endonuclease